MTNILIRRRSPQEQKELVARREAEATERCAFILRAARDRDGRLRTMAVVTRTGALVHIADPEDLRAHTFCGREWVDFHHADVDTGAANCRACKRGFTASDARSSVEAPISHQKASPCPPETSSQQQEPSS